MDEKRIDEGVLENVAGGRPENYEEKDNRVKAAMGNPVSGMTEEKAEPVRGAAFGATIHIWDIAPKIKERFDN